MSVGGRGDAQRIATTAVAGAGGGHVRDGPSATGVAQSPAAAEVAATGMAVWVAVDAAAATTLSAVDGASATTSSVVYKALPRRSGEERKWKPVAAVAGQRR